MHPFINTVARQSTNLIFVSIKKGKNCKKPITNEKIYSTKITKNSFFYFILHFLFFLATKFHELIMTHLLSENTNFHAIENSNGRDRCRF